MKIEAFLEKYTLRDIKNVEAFPSRLMLKLEMNDGLVLHYPVQTYSEFMRMYRTAGGL